MRNVLTPFLVCAVFVAVVFECQISTESHHVYSTSVLVDGIEYSAEFRIDHSGGRWPFLADVAFVLTSRLDDPSADATLPWRAVEIVAPHVIAFERTDGSRITTRDVRWDYPGHANPGVLAWSIDGTALSHDWFRLDELSFRQVFPPLGFGRAWMPLRTISIGVLSVALAIVLSAPALGLMILQEWRRVNDRCWNCGYPARVLGAFQCSECGEPIREGRESTTGSLLIRANLICMLVIYVAVWLRVRWEVMPCVAEIAWVAALAAPIVCGLAVLSESQQRTEVPKVTWGNFVISVWVLVFFVVISLFA